MKFSNQSHALRIMLDTKDCELSSVEIEHMEEDLHTLRELVADFPVSDLHVTVVHHPRGGDYHVRTTLALPDRRIFTGDRHAKVHPAYERCLRKLVKKVRAYKHEMRIGEDSIKQAKGTRQTVEPIAELDVSALVKTVKDDDYLEFRRKIDLFEPALSERIARWLGKYPEIQTQFEWPVSVSDIVEEVFLNAFDQFDLRSHDVSPGDWLENLIDPSVQAILQSPDDEYMRIEFSSAAFNQ
ncbi:hypothetical protein CA13_30560 [Planctomycetes bacterium CA13]|uniref:Sigma 54 modulation protein / S30EA ribosomal protein n=1 Tax=Novipirellula herctigrandis TaxID=2527986 RepID=A0A5C5Z4W9_9BACT|nr:hypothetical protein CA13_30560 [Planctomycetes bacterium CA13]